MRLPNVSCMIRLMMQLHTGTTRHYKSPEVQIHVSTSAASSRFSAQSASQLNLIDGSREAIANEGTRGENWKQTHSRRSAPTYLYVFK